MRHYLVLQMINNIRLVILLVAMLVCERPAYAWDPCMPFCDAECSGMAMTTMASNVSSTLSTLKSTCTSLKTERSNLSSMVTDTFADMSKEVALFYPNMLSAIDASTSQLLFSTTSQTVAFSNFVDTINGTLWLNSSNYSKLIEFMYNRENLGPYSRGRVKLLELGLCAECELEAISVGTDTLTNRPYVARDFAAIIYEGVTNKFSNNNEKNDVITYQNSRTNLLANPNFSWSDINLYAKSVSFSNYNRFANDNYGNVRLKLFGIYIGEYHSFFSFSEESDYKELSRQSLLEKSSLMSFLSGFELDTLNDTSTLSEIGLLNGHGLNHKLAISRQVESTQYLALYKLSAIKNVLKAIDIAEEIFE